jgi:acyl-CoA thioesterase-1
VTIDTIRYAYALGAFLALLLLPACSEPRLLQPLSQDARILAFGDSLTYGTGAAPQESYPAVLSRLTGLEVINAGMPGETTGQGLARLPALLRETSPDLLILLEGGNDILRSVRPEVTKRNLAEMVAAARASGVQVVILGVPDKLLFSASAPLYEELARELQIAFDGETMGSLLRDRDLKSDAVHLNGVGYRLMAEAIHELLLTQGALY